MSAVVKPVLLGLRLSAEVSAVSNMPETVKEPKACWLELFGG